MDRIAYIFVWFSRCFHVLGFGIQSPTDYLFVRKVINEHRPYYAYENLGSNDSWLRRKLGLLYFRLSNFRQPNKVIDHIGVSEYVISGCKKAQLVDECNIVELAFLSDVDDVFSLLSRVDDQSMIIVEISSSQRNRWKKLLSDSRVIISYDLYYCGILMFDRKRVKQHYIINF